MKTTLLITCAVVATTVTVRSQSSIPPTSPAFALISEAPAEPVSTRASMGVNPKNQAAVELSEVDLSALRYFASQNDVGRVAAEIRLIRTTHQNWEPPDDLFAEGRVGADEQPLWDLFAKHDLAALHAKMDEMRQTSPGWQPSSNLAGKLALAEAHDVLVQASDEKRWNDVVRVATANKMLLTCSDVDALWRTAEALSQTGDEARAVEAYRYMLATCSSGAERLATVQKAALVLKSPDDFGKLIEMAKQLPDGRGEFDQIRLDLLRRKIGEAAGGTSKDIPTKAEIDQIAAIATTPAGQSDAQLLGWYSYATGDYAVAQRWFETDLAFGKDGKAAEGLVLALRAAGDTTGARSAALRYGDLDAANRKLMVEVVSTDLTDPAAKPLTSDEMTALTTGVDEAKSIDGAQALGVFAASRHDMKGAAEWNKKFATWQEEDILQKQSAEEANAYGWQLFHDGKIANSERWFKQSADWQKNESAAIGLILVAYGLHHKQDYERLTKEYSGMFAGVAKLEAAARPRPGAQRPIRTAVVAVPARKVLHPVIIAKRQGHDPGGNWDQSASDIVRAAHDGKFETALAMLDQRSARKSEPRGLSVVRGWALFQHGDWDQAKKVFSKLDKGQYSPERQEGLRVIDMMYTNPRYR